jgi:K+-sensing histidine kinase KdpD
VPALRDATESGIVQWVYVNRRPAGLGTDTFGDRPTIYLPLATARRALGAMVIRPAEPERHRAPEQLHLLETVANQLAAAMERAQLTEESRRLQQREEMDRLKSEFVAVASHELGVPLRSLTRSLAALRGAGDGPPAPDEACRLLDAAGDDVDRLRALVDDLLDLSRLEAGRLELDLRPTAPADLVGAAIAEVERRAAAAGTELTSDVPRELPLVAADPRRITGVLVSLLDNALRFAGSAGHVDVSADVVGRYVQLSVADDGPGVPVEEQARIFDKFVRLATPRGGPGMGLGLAIAREVVRGHRGAIWVDSGPGPGSVFSFTLPIA